MKCEEGIINSMNTMIKLALVVLLITYANGIVIIGYCFDPSTTVELETGNLIAVEMLGYGDKIVSYQSSEQGNGKIGGNYIDMVTDVEVIEEGGPFSAHTFILQGNIQINVTSPHVMYTFKMDGENLIPVTAAAKDVKVNDVMRLIDGSFVKVTQVLDFELNRKVAINTAGGSFFANGVLTTGMCENYNSEDDLNIPSKILLESYAASHQDWNNCIATAKDFSIPSESILHTCLAIAS